MAHAVPTEFLEDETSLLATADHSIDREMKAPTGTYLCETYRSSKDGQPYA
jgi:hypothetical protein